MNTTIPFRLAGRDQPLILVPAKINGLGPCEFILDTGAGPSLVTPELAHEAGIASTEVKKGMGVAGTTEIRFGRARSIEVGSAELSDVPLGITGELHRIGRAVGAEIHGDLGHSFLQHFRVTVDYGRGLLSLGRDLDEGSSPEAFDQEPDTELPIRLAHPAKPLILLPVEVNGAGPYQFALDTGASTTTIAPELARALSLSLEEMEPITGAGGRIAASSGRLELLAVGAARVARPHVLVSDFFKVLGDAIGTHLDGILGFNFLREFTVEIDYPAARLRLWRPTVISKSAA